MLDYVTRDGKRLRRGYTTGTCAAGAAGAATQMLLTGRAVERLDVDTPKGIRLSLDILEPEIKVPLPERSVRAFLDYISGH